MSRGFSGEGAVVSHGSFAFLPSSPETFVSGITGDAPDPEGASGREGAGDERRLLRLCCCWSIGTTLMMEEVGYDKPEKIFKIFNLIQILVIISALVS